MAAEDDLDIANAATAGTLTIQGNGATIQRDPTLTCTLNGTDAVGEFRIFEVHTGVNLTLQNVTVTNGCADGSSFPDGAGGGIVNLSTAVPNLSLSTVTITNSTISGNSTGGDGGGIWNGGTLNASFVTIANNSAGAGGQGGGIFSDAGTVNIKNSIVGDNTAGGGGANCSGGVTASGANLATDGSCSGFTQVTSAALNLQPLGNYGGATETHALPAGSVAIDGVLSGQCNDLNNTLVTTDQRGVPRPQGARCDVGAYETTRGFTGSAPVAGYLGLAFLATVLALLGRSSLVRRSP